MASSRLSSSIIVGCLPEGREGRLLALALLACVLLVGWIGVVEPLANLHAAQHEEFVSRTRLAERMRALAMELPALRKKAAEVAAVGDRPTLQAGTEAMAAAKLQEVVQELLAASGASTTSIEIIPAESAGSNRRIATRVEVTGTLPMLVGLIGEIEGNRLPMLIDDVQIKRTDTDFLQASFTVVTFRSEP